MISHLYVAYISFQWQDSLRMNDYKKKKDECSPNWCRILVTNYLCHWNECKKGFDKYLTENKWEKTGSIYNELSNKISIKYFRCDFTYLFIIEKKNEGKREDQRQQGRREKSQKIRRKGEIKRNKNWLGCIDIRIAGMYF